MKKKRGDTETVFLEIRSLWPYFKGYPYLFNIHVFLICLFFSLCSLCQKFLLCFYSCWCYPRLTYDFPFIHFCWSFNTHKYMAYITQPISIFVLVCIHYTHTDLLVSVLYLSIPWLKKTVSETWGRDCHHHLHRHMPNVWTPTLPWKGNVRLSVSGSLWFVSSVPWNGKKQT